MRARMFFAIIAITVASACAEIPPQANPPAAGVTPSSGSEVTLKGAGLTADLKSVVGKTFTNRESFSPRTTRAIQIRGDGTAIMSLRTWTEQKFKYCDGEHPAKVTTNEAGRIAFEHTSVPNGLPFCRDRWTFERVGNTLVRDDGKVFE